MRISQSGRSQSGAALILAAFAVAVVGILAAVLAVAVARSSRAAQRAAARETLSAAAESGAELALSRLAADRSWSGARAQAVPGGACDISVRRLPGGGFEVTSTAAGSAGVVIVKETLRESSGGRFRITAWQSRAAPAGARR